MKTEHCLFFFPIVELANDISKCIMTVGRYLKELEKAGLIIRIRQEFGKPNRIYVLVPKKEN